MLRNQKSILTLIKEKRVYFHRRGLEECTINGKKKNH